MDEERLAKLTQRVYALEQRTEELARFAAEHGFNKVAASAPGAIASNDDAAATHADVFTTLTPSTASIASIASNASTASVRPDTPDAFHKSSLQARPTVRPNDRPTDRPSRFAISNVNENILAVRLLLFAGLALLLIGAGFAVQFAIANQWISPQARIILGLIAGFALVFGSHRIRSGPYLYAAEGGIGLGAGLMYLSLWAAAAVFHFIPTAVAGAAMGAITLLLAALAYARKSERVALIGAVAGFAVPIVAPDGNANIWSISAYLLMLGALMLGIASISAWRIVPWVIFAGDMLYTSMIADGRPYAVKTLFFEHEIIALLFTAEFCGFFIRALLRIPVLTFRDRRVAENLFGFAIIISVLTCVQFTMLGISNVERGFCLLMLACGMLGLSAYFRRRRPLAATSAIAAIGIATLSLPSFFSGGSLADAFAIEATGVAYAALRLRSLRIGYAALSAFVLIGLSTPRGHLPGDAFVVNIAFLHRAIWLGATWAALRFVMQIEENIQTRRWMFFCFHLAILTIAGSEIVDTAPAAIANFSLSLFLTVYSTAVLSYGLRTNITFWVRSGLALFATTIFKVIFYDLSFVELGLRIILLSIVGACCVAASLAYQRRITKG